MVAAPAPDPSARISASSAVVSTAGDAAAPCWWRASCPRSASPTRSSTSTIAAVVASRGGAACRAETPSGASARPRRRSRTSPHRPDGMRAAEDRVRKRLVVDAGDVDREQVLLEAVQVLARLPRRRPGRTGSGRSRHRPGPRGSGFAHGYKGRAHHVADDLDQLGRIEGLDHPAAGAGGAPARFISSPDSVVRIRIGVVSNPGQPRSRPVRGRCRPGAGMFWSVSIEVEMRRLGEGIDAVHRLDHVEAGVAQREAHHLAHRGRIVHARMAGMAVRAELGAFTGGLAARAAKLQGACSRLAASSSRRPATRRRNGARSCCIRRGAIGVPAASRTVVRHLPAAIARPWACVGQTTQLARPGRRSSFHRQHRARADRLRAVGAHPGRASPQRVGPDDPRRREEQHRPRAGGGITGSPSRPAPRSPPPSARCSGCGRRARDRRGSRSCTRAGRRRSPRGR